MVEYILGNIGLEAALMVLELFLVFNKTCGGHGAKAAVGGFLRR